jgi:hypothetical protein
LRAHARSRWAPYQPPARAEQLGLLHGLPTGIKDLHETAGLLTTYGSPLYRSHDAAMIALVRKAGVGRIDTLLNHVLNDRLHLSHCAADMDDERQQALRSGRDQRCARVVRVMPRL